MSIKGWRYYNHALIPTCAPHETPDVEALKDTSMWSRKMWGGVPLLARWTTDWDCNQETNWWYEICDKPFEISELKSDKRYKINKGLKNFEIQVIDPEKYTEQLYDVYVKAVKSYPTKNQTQHTFDSFSSTVLFWKNDKNTKIYAAFLKETKALCGYIVGTFQNGYFGLSQQKANPDYEKLQVNAAMVYSFIVDNTGLLKAGIYCNDGERSINHETNFQEYLERYFAFRKAYCHLNIKYRYPLGILIRILYPLRKMILYFDNMRVFHQINGILKMEEIMRKEKV